MNKKGQSLNLTIMVFISILVGLVLFQVIAQQVGSSTNTVAVANDSLGTVAASDTIYLTNYRAISDVVIYNSTVIVPAANYTVTNNVVYNGALAVQVDVSADTLSNYEWEWNISGTGQPLTYIDNSGARSMSSLIIIFFALAIVLVALYPVYEGKLSSLFGR